jgi:tRNA modification GTPase
MTPTPDTIAAPATPSGTAAIALLRISGPDTENIARALAGTLPEPRQAQRTDYHDLAGRLVDDVLLTFYRGPASYTGEDTLEISCHGNPYIVQRIFEDLLQRGCRAAGPGEFTQRAFLNGRMDLSQAEAVMDLIHARGERALQAANQQLRGALGRKMSELIEGLLGSLARIEAYIDFPDEDLPPADRKLLDRELVRLQQETQKLLTTSHYGNILRDGLKVVILGQPNVGKSSLLNRLVGHDRALVSAEPGTTRDYLEERILLGDHCLRLIDTAGLNLAPAPIEQLGIEKSMDRLQEADLVLLVLDASVPPPQFAAGVRQSLTPANTLVVLNKADLPPAPASASAFAGFESVATSAITGVGLEVLSATLSQRAAAFHVELGEDLIAINARHADALGRAQASLTRAIEQLEANDPTELIAHEMREVLAAYGEIAGKIDNERMLDHLFATFCIGK